MKHTHCEAIKAWADGAKIEFLELGVWEVVDDPSWGTRNQYRVKPSFKDLEDRRDAARLAYMAACEEIRASTDNPVLHRTTTRRAK